MWMLMLFLLSVQLHYIHWPRLWLGLGLGKCLRFLNDSLMVHLAHLLLLIRLIIHLLLLSHLLQISIIILWWGMTNKLLT